RAGAAGAWRGLPLGFEVGKGYTTLSRTAQCRNGQGSCRIRQRLWAVAAIAPGSAISIRPSRIEVSIEAPPGWLRKIGLASSLLFPMAYGEAKEAGRCSDATSNHRKVSTGRRVGGAMRYDGGRQEGPADGSRSSFARVAG